MTYNEWPLPYFLGFPGEEKTYSTDDQIIYLFYFGLEKFLLAISSIISASIFNSESIPPGFTGKFSRCLNKPVLGILLNDYIYTAIKDCKNPSLINLIQYLLETEKEDGWISKMISLRNIYIHLKNKSTDEIIGDAKDHLKSIPDFYMLGNFKENEGSIFWDSAGRQIIVSPFMYAEENELFVFKEFDKGGSLIFQHDRPDLNLIFKIGFNKLRSLDLLLENPTRDDIVKRIIPISDVYEKSKYWWFGNLKKSSYTLNLVDRDLLIQVLLFINNETSCIFIELNGMQQPLEIICEQLGLYTFKDTSEFVEAIGGELLYIGIAANNIGVKDFSSLINWIVAVTNEDASNNLHFIVERATEKIINDQQKLFGRMPEELSKILGGPSGSFKDDLMETVWKKQTRRKFIFF